MSDLCSPPARLRRPRLLIRAARHGIEEYRRDRDLSRLFGGVSVPAPIDALPRLMREEARLEAIRSSGAAAYSLMRHIEVLIALLAEARAVAQRPLA